MGIELRWPVALAAPSINTLYNAPLSVGRALVIGISQSGRAADVKQVVEEARASGAITLSITNDPQSPLALAAEHHIALRCGEEISIAATKTYTAQLMAVALLVAELKGDDAFRKALYDLPEFVAQTLELGAHIPQTAQRYRYAERMVALGRGYNYSTAFELAQKIRELCYMPVEDYSEADFRHGPIAMVAPGFPSLVIAPSGATQPLMIDLLHKLRERRAECIVISDSPEALSLGHTALALPPNIPEWLSPICAVIPGQQLAMNMALVKGNPVDRPEGLSKVTITK
jgi:glutamine---fructose-6-phosphate transaminase (isomerizing)